MRLRNTKANKKKYKRLQAVKWTLIVLVMLPTLAGAALCLISFAVMYAAIVLVVGGGISLMIGFAFSGKLDKTQEYVDVDFSQNLAVCDCCGRQLSIKDLEWKDGVLREGESVYNDSGNRTTSYTYSVSVSGKCPNCGKSKNIAIVENGGSYSSGLKHIAFTNKDTSYHKDNTIRYDDKKLVQDRLRKDSYEARSSLDKYLSMGYVVENESKSVKTKPTKETTRAIYYSVYLDDAGQDVEAVVKVLERYYNPSRARHLAEVGGLIGDHYAKVSANDLVKNLEKVGATARMEEQDY